MATVQIAVNELKGKKRGKKDDCAVLELTKIMRGTLNLMDVFILYTPNSLTLP